MSNLNNHLEIRAGNFYLYLLADRNGKPVRNEIRKIDEEQSSFKVLMKASVDEAPGREILVTYKQTVSGYWLTFDFMGAEIRFNRDWFRKWECHTNAPIGSFIGTPVSEGTIALDQLLEM